MLTTAMWERSRCSKAFAVYCLEMGWAPFPLQPLQGFLIRWCVKTVLWLFSSLLFGYIDPMRLLLSHSFCHQLCAATERLHLHSPEAALSFPKAPTIHCCCFFCFSWSYSDQQDKEWREQRNTTPSYTVPVTLCRAEMLAPHCGSCLYPRTEACRGFIACCTASNKSLLALN